MKQRLKTMLRNTPWYLAAKRRRQQRKLIEWERSGRPVPPPHMAKQRAIKEYAKKFGLKVLVETGTFEGDMVEATKDDFDRIYTIELSQSYYEKAKKRFQGQTKIELIHGDSAVELSIVIHRIDQPALFWLDGHYSAGETARGEKDTPIYEELGHILDVQDRGHVILIDDARCFGTKPGYPCIDELRAFVLSKRPDVDITVQDDSIRITPRV